MKPNPSIAMRIVSRSYRVSRGNDTKKRSLFGRLQSDAEEDIHAPRMTAVIGLDRGWHAVRCHIRPDTGLDVANRRDVARVSRGIGKDAETATGGARQVLL